MTLHKRQGSKYRRATLADVRRWLAPQGYEVVKMTRDVDDGGTNPTPLMAARMDRNRWKGIARKMAAEARWWRRRRERQLSHIDRAKEEVARQRHRGLRHWAKWVQRGQQLECVTAQRDAARAEVDELHTVIDNLRACIDRLMDESMTALETTAAFDFSGEADDGR